MGMGMEGMRSSESVFHRIQRSRKIQAHILTQQVMAQDTPSSATMTVACSLVLAQKVPIMTQTKKRWLKVQMLRGVNQLRNHLVKFHVFDGFFERMKSEAPKAEKSGSMMEVRTAMMD